MKTLISESMIENGIQKLESNILNKKKILNEAIQFLSSIFQNCSVNIYLFNNKTQQIDLSASNTDLWPIPFYEKNWISLKDSSKKEYLYIEERDTFILTDYKQLYKDKIKFNYNCSDGLYLKIKNTNNHTIGLIFIHNWEQKQKLSKNFQEFNTLCLNLNSYIIAIVKAIENYETHKKIQSLLKDKSDLKKRIEKDEKDLTKRILELTTLYETSNELSHLFDYKEIISKIIMSLNKALNFDTCVIFLNDYLSKNELFIQINPSSPKKAIENIIISTMSALEPFLQMKITASNLNIYKEQSEKTQKPIMEFENIKSFANIPLIFKDEIIGILSIGALEENAFSKEGLQFFHTLTNHLSSTLGRVKIIKELEKSKIESVINSMTDAVMMIEDSHALEIINPAAAKLLNIKNITPIKKEKLFQLLENVGLLNLYKKATYSQNPILNTEVSLNKNTFSINISPVLNEENKHTGTVLVFRDITQFKRIDRIKTQRLNAISKINLIIKSIQNLNHLLDVIMDFILHVTNSDMGSIQLKENESYVTKVHSNFPDKIRRSYRYLNGKTISQTVQENKKIILLDKYFDNDNINTNVKILIDCYLCIPIILNNETIGIINLARKFGSPADPFNKEDLQTIDTITLLIGTAIQNALYYEDKLQKQKLDQELKIATEIQKNLLPRELPKIDGFLFGTLNVPARAIGGDYYDFIEIDNNHLGIIIADIVGKGIPAGLFMAMLKSIFNQHTKGTLSPKQVLTKLNQIIYSDPVITKFVPLFYGILNTKNKTLTYTNAGQEPPLILRKKKFIKLDTKGFPLGGLEETEFEEKQIHIINNDQLTFLTDGIIEIRNKNNQAFGYRRFYTFLKKYENFPPNVIINKLHDTLKDFSSNYTQTDDITAIICKISTNLKHTKTNILLKSEEVRIQSEIKFIKTIRHKTRDICKILNFNEKHSIDIELAVNEAHANIIEHAYLGDKTKDIIFKFNVYNDKLEIMIRDLGININLDIIKKNKNNKQLENLDGSGLGTFLIHTLMDEVEYTKKEVGTELRLVKYKI